MQHNEREVLKVEQGSSSGITSSVEELFTEFDLKIKNTAKSLESYQRDLKTLVRIEEVLNNIQKGGSDINAENKGFIIEQLALLSSLIEKLNPKKGGLRSAFKEVPWKKLIYLGKVLLQLNNDGEKEALLMQSLKYICAEDVPNLSIMVQGFVSFCTKKIERHGQHLDILSYRKQKIEAIEMQLAVTKNELSTITTDTAKIDSIKNIISDKKPDKDERIRKIKEEVLANTQDEELIRLITSLSTGSKTQDINYIKTLLGKRQEYLSRTESYLKAHLNNIMNLVPAHESDKAVIESIIQKLVYVVLSITNVERNISVAKNITDLEKIIVDIQFYLRSLCDIAEGGIVHDQSPIILLLKNITGLINDIKEKNINPSQLEGVKNGALVLLNELYPLAYSSLYSKELAFLQAAKAVITSIHNDVKPTDTDTQPSKGSKKAKAVDFSGKWDNQLKNLRPLLYLLAQSTVNLDHLLNGEILGRIIRLINMDSEDLKNISDPKNKETTEKEVLAILLAIEQAESLIKEAQESDTKKKFVVKVLPLAGVSSLCNYFFDSGNIQKMIGDLGQLLAIRLTPESMMRCAILQVLFELGESVHDLTDIKRLTLEQIPWLELVSLRNRITHQAMDTLVGITRLNQFLMMIEPNNLDQQRLVDQLTLACIENMKTLLVMLEKLNSLHTKMVSNEGYLDFNKIIEFHYIDTPLGFEIVDLSNLSLLRQYFHEPTSIITSDHLTFKIVTLSEPVGELTEESTSKRELSITELTERIQVVKLVTDNLAIFLKGYGTNHIATLASRFCLTYIGQIFRELNNSKTFLLSAPPSLCESISQLISLRGDIAHNMLVKAIKLEIKTFQVYIELGPLFDLTHSNLQLVEIAQTNLEMVNSDVTTLINNINNDISGYFNVLLDIHSLNKENPIAHNLKEFLDSTSSTKRLETFRLIKLAIDCYSAHLSPRELKKDIIATYLQQITEIKVKWLKHYDHQFIELEKLKLKLKDLDGKLPSELIEAVSKDIELTEERLKQELAEIKSTNFFEKLDSLLNKLEPHQKVEGQCFKVEQIAQLNDALTHYSPLVIQLMDKYEDDISQLSKDDKEGIKKEFGSINKQIYNLLSSNNLAILLKFIDSPKEFKIEEVLPELSTRQQLLTVIHTLTSLKENPVPALTDHWQEIKFKWSQLLDAKKEKIIKIQLDLESLKSTLTDDPLALEQIAEYEKKLLQILNGINNTQQFIDRHDSAALLQSFTKLIENKDQLTELKQLITTSMEERTTAPWPKQSSGTSQKSYEELRKRSKDKEKGESMEEGHDKNRDRDRDPNPDLGGSSQGFYG